MPVVLVELIVVLVGGFLGGTGQRLLRALVSSDDLADALKALPAIKSRDAVGLALSVLGGASIAMSYWGFLWATGPRADWWTSFHLEIGVGLMFVGLVDALLMSRLK